MKRLLLGDPRKKLVTMLEMILQHWGYRVLPVARPEKLSTLMEETAPDLILLHEAWLVDTALADRLGEQTGLILLGDTGSTVPAAPGRDRLDVPLDIFSLFATVQKHLEKYPRQNMRLALQLPAMLCRAESCHLGEVLSLSSQGVFIKSGFRFQEGECFSIVLPLLGMQQELELSGRVLYCVAPDPKNNYQQGAGVEFTDLDPDHRRCLKHYLEHLFLDELVDSGRDLSHRGQESDIPLLRLLAATPSENLRHSTV